MVIQKKSPRISEDIAANVIVLKTDKFKKIIVLSQLSSSELIVTGNKIRRINHRHFNGSSKNAILNAIDQELLARELFKTIISPFVTNNKRNGHGIFS